MKALFKKNLVFILPYLAFIIGASIILMHWNKASIHLYINQFHNAFFDVFFKYWTFLGNGITAVIIVLFFLLFIKIRDAIIIAIAYVSSSLITQLLKHTFFSGMLRPKAFFAHSHALYLVPGVDVYSLNSFPSGHATTALAVCFVLALLSNKKSLKFLLVIIALLICYSRIYLSEHFLMDVFAGSLIGFISAWFSYYSVMNSKALSNIKLDHPLYSKQHK